MIADKPLAERPSPSSFLRFDEDFVDEKSCLLTKALYKDCCKGVKGQQTTSSVLTGRYLIKNSILKYFFNVHVYVSAGQDSDE